MTSPTTQALDDIHDTSERWHGFKSYQFQRCDTTCKVVAPERAAPENPWIWRARFFGHEPQFDLALLNRGFHLAYCEVGGLFGSPQAVSRWDDFYAFATNTLGFSDKVVLEGMSRGGLIVFNWAMANPDKVAAIYADAPVCDIKSWPAGNGCGTGSPGEWEECMAAYGFADEAEALAHEPNPLDHAEALATAGIPVVIVYGKDDEVVPPIENCLSFAERFERAGGTIRMIGKDDCGHHPHGLSDPKPIVDFVLDYLDWTADDFTAPPYIEVRRGLANSYAAFASGGQARVAFLGGSITEMDGWRNLVGESLQKRFPETTFDFVNAGIGSTDSTMGAFRMGEDAFRNGKVDLLFIESAVNELGNRRHTDEIQRGVEGIIRQAHAHNPEIDVVAQYFYDPRYLDILEGGSMPWQIQVLDELSEHYVLPSINQVVYLSRALEAEEITQEEFGDCHPKPPGHALYLKAIDELFDEAWSARPAAVGAYDLSPVRRDDCFRFGTYRDVAEATLGESWAYVESWQPSEGKTRKQFVNCPVVETTTPGAELTFTFSGTAVGIVFPSGPDIGILEFKVDDGDWNQQDLFTQWSRNLHIPWIHVLEPVLAPGEHTLTLRTSESKNSDSTGHACRICAFAVNQTP